MASSLSATNLTMAEFELRMKLESIFMPQARRQRDETYGRHTRPGQQVETAHLRFVHYTSAEAALNIIKTKRIWMRNAMCMADYREVQYGFDIFNQFFGNSAKRSEFVAALDDSVQGAASEAIDAFNQHWKDIRFNTYITSVSEHDQREDLHGRLSMWRGFGGSSARIAMVFHIPWFSGVSEVLKILFSPVTYLTGEQVHARLDEVVGNVAENREFLKQCGRQTVVDWVFTMLVAGVTCLKHEGFREECEWRAIYSPNRRPSPLMESSTEIVSGVPQPIYKLPLDATGSPALAHLDFSRIFDRLIIGPSQYSLPMTAAFAEALTKTGVEDALKRVWISGIPIRT